MKLRSQFTLLRTIALGACSGDGDGDGPKPMGTTLNIENPRRPALNRDGKSFKSFKITSKVYPQAIK